MILGEGLNYSYTSKIIGKEETENFVFFSGNIPEFCRNFRNFSEIFRNFFFRIFPEIPKFFFSEFFLEFSEIFFSETENSGFFSEFRNFRKILPTLNFM